MKFSMTAAWDEQCGIPLSKLLVLIDAYDIGMNKKTYGSFVRQIGTVLVCLPHDYKQRKRFVKKESKLGFEIILDYFLIKNVDIEQKKKIIRKQIVDITEQTLSKYNLGDFDKSSFMADFKEIASGIVW